MFECQSLHNEADRLIVRGFCLCLQQHNCGSVWWNLIGGIFLPAVLIVMTHVGMYRN